MSAAKPIEPVANKAEEILKTATRIFAQHGYRNTDVQQIADELGFGKGTIYRHFAAKQELFFGCLDRGMELLHAQMEKVFESDLEPLDKLRHGIRTYFSFFEQNSDLVELFIQERAEFRDRPQVTYFEHREKHVSCAREFWQGLVSQGVIRNLPVDSLCDILSQLLYGTLFVHYFSRRQKPLSDRAEEIINVVIGGFLNVSDPAGAGGVLPGSATRTNSSAMAS